MIIVGNRTILLGITGTIAAGKSTVTRMLRQQGVPCFDADSSGHEALDLPEVKRSLLRVFGTEIFQAPIAGDITDSPSLDLPAVDRKQLAKAVFASHDPDRSRRRLEEIVHPVILSDFHRFRQAQEQAGVPLTVLDAPLLFETGWNQLCDVVLCVDADEDIRAARAKNRHWSRGEFLRREKSQWPADRKRQAADFVLDNNLSRDSLAHGLSQVLKRIRKREEPRSGG